MAVFPPQDVGAGAVKLPWEILARWMKPGALDKDCVKPRALATGVLFSVAT
jgi:hypothetical protein